MATFSNSAMSAAVSCDCTWGGLGWPAVIFADAAALAVAATAAAVATDAPTVPAGATCCGLTGGSGGGLLDSGSVKKS